jgi:hypothetical protein
MGDDYLKALARKGREASARERRLTDEAVRERQEAADRAREERLHAAFGTGGRAMLFAGPVFLGGIAGAVVLFESRSCLLGAIVLIAGPLVGFVVFALAKASATERVNRWLKGMPFAFDHKRYLDELGRSDMQPQVQVHVTFRAPVPPEQHATIEAALVGATGSGGAKCSGNQLRVLSPPMSGYHLGGDHDSPSRYNKGKHHAWFKRLVDRGLVVVHERHPIESIDVTVGP